MFLGVSVFGELNGHTRWDFSERGLLLNNSKLPPGISLLDQSVNHAFSRDTRLVVLVRDPKRDRMLVWIGLYLYAREPRGAKGAQGAGLWLCDSASDGRATLGFLDNVAGRLAELGIADWAERPDWSRIDPDHARLKAFADSAKLNQPSAVKLDPRETTCLMDLTADHDAYGLARWLSEVQTMPELGRHKRIFLSEDAAVSRQLQRQVNKVYEPRPDSELPRPPSQLAPADAGLVSASAERTGDPLARIRGELDQLRAQVNEDYTATRKRNDDVDRLLARLARTDKLVRWVGLPALLLCLLTSAWQVALWSGVAGQPGVADTSVAAADAAPKPATPPPQPSAPAAAGQLAATDQPKPEPSAAPPIPERTTDPTWGIRELETRCKNSFKGKATFSREEVDDRLDRCFQPSSVAAGSKPNHNNHN